MITCKPCVKRMFYAALFIYKRRHVEAFSQHCDEHLLSNVRFYCLNADDIRVCSGAATQRARSDDLTGRSTALANDLARRIALLR